jgi:hypothetical protein
MITSSFGEEQLMNDKRMQTAAELIRRGDFVGARALLETIDTPKAREWIKQIESRSESQKPKRSFRSCLVILILFFVVFLVVGLLMMPPTPRVNITADQRVLTPPADLNISGSDQQLSEELLENLQRNLTQYGQVTSFTSGPNNDRRLVTDIVVRVQGPQNRDFALEAIEHALRVYGKYTTERNIAGEFSVLANWYRGTVLCADNAGIGYRTMQRINWNTASQSNIFRAIDLNAYSDTVDYGNVGYAPDESGIEVCNR